MIINAIKKGIGFGWLQIFVMVRLIRNSSVKSIPVRPSYSISYKICTQTNMYKTNKNFKIRKIHVWNFAFKIKRISNISTHRKTLN